MKYGKELVKELEANIARNRAAIADRQNRIDNGMTDMEDCFVSEHFESQGIHNDTDKIRLIENGGCAWFTEYATLDGTLIEARWVKSNYGGTVLRAEMPDGSVVWTSAMTEKGLAKKGIKLVKCLRPAWYKFRSNGRGLAGAYCGSYCLTPSEVNYATGEAANDEPVEMCEFDWAHAETAGMAE